MNRRTFIAAGTAATLSAQVPSDIPIIDTHVHLYDPSRPQGVPWPPKSNTMIYRTTLPSRLRQVTEGLGVVGAVEVECSPWLEDNQWVLDVSAKDRIMVGMVGNLEPEKPDFRKHLDRFAKNPLYRGIRYGDLWDRNLGTAVVNPAFIRGLKELATAGLSFDTANPSVRLLGDVVRISDQVPERRIIIDHLPALYPPSESKQRALYDGYLREFRQRPNVYAKLSAVLRMQGDKKVSWDLKDHRDRLDLLYETFGPDRLLYGSDWPNSDPSAPYAKGLAVMQEYFRGKGHEAGEKYFWRNSVRAYRWIRREPGQPAPEAAALRASLLAKRR